MINLEKIKYSDFPSPMEDIKIYPPPFKKEGVGANYVEGERHQNIVKIVLMTLTTLT